MVRDILKSVPEAFYELFVYLTPATYFLIAGSLSFSLKTIIPLEYIEVLKWPFGVASLIVIIGALFALGQILNTLTHYAYYYIPPFSSILNEYKAAWRSRKSKWIFPFRTVFEEHDTRWRRAQNNRLELSGHMAKIRAKRIMSQTLSFASLLLIFGFLTARFVGIIEINSGIEEGWTIALISIIMGVSYLDGQKRLKDELDFLRCLPLKK